MEPLQELAKAVLEGRVWIETVNWTNRDDGSGQTHTVKVEPAEDMIVVSGPSDDEKRIAAQALRDYADGMSCGCYANTHPGYAHDCAMDQPTFAARLRTRADQIEGKR